MSYMKIEKDTYFIRNFIKATLQNRIIIEYNKEKNNEIIYS